MSDGTAPLRLAHRGDHRTVPENTLAAFRAALSVRGCDGLEFDVQLSGDGVPVILHDETLERVQGLPARCDELTATELDAHGIPTLGETLALVGRSVGGGQIPFLDVELKIDCGLAGVEVLQAGRGPALARAVVSSFEPTALETVRRLRPAWPTWLNVEDLEPATVALARDLGCAGVSAERTSVDEVTVARVRDAGLALAAWTVVSVEESRRLAALGVEALCVEGEALDRS